MAEGDGVCAVLFLQRKVPRILRPGDLGHPVQVGGRRHSGGIRRPDGAVVPVVDVPHDGGAVFEQGLAGGVAGGHFLHGVGAGAPETLGDGQPVAGPGVAHLHIGVADDGVVGQGGGVLQRRQQRRGFFGIRAGGAAAQQHGRQRGAR